MKALQIAASGMSAQQMRVDVVSNNLANMSTTGYNARRAEFADLHYQQMARPGTISAEDGTVLPTGVQIGLGVRPAAVSMVLAQGSLTQTNGDLDVAIEGRGYLEVTLPSGAFGLYARWRAETDGRWRDCHLRWLSGGAGHHHSVGCAQPVDQRRWRGLRLFRRPGAARIAGAVQPGRVHQ